MAKQRLFTERPEPDDQTRATPHERFEQLATKLTAVTKAEIDRREKAWKRDKVKA